VLVLASASPRRRDLLAAAGVEFSVEPTHVDESLPAGLSPKEAALRLAVRKAEAALARRAGQSAWLIAADTVVGLALRGGWRLLGKPVDACEASEMLRSLSGTRHQVATGVAVARGVDGAVEAEVEVTEVTMRPITEGEIEAYVESQEWRGKAGGYAIQETADRFVAGLCGGGLDNVVGLPVKLTLALLTRLGAPVAGGPSGS
jgi:septum formation protein